MSESSEARIFIILDEIRAQNSDIRERLVGLEAVKCPDPGACVRLSEEMHELKRSVAGVNSDVVSLKLTRAEKVGERTITLLACAVVGSVVTWIIELVSKK